MGTPMHFRKRQLRDYQIEANASKIDEPQFTQINETSNYNHNIFEPQINYEYPLSPLSSVHSDQSITPTKHTNNETPYFDSLIQNEYSTDQMQVMAKNTVALLDMENLSPQSNKNAHKLKEIAENLTALENFTRDPNAKQITYDPKTLIDFAYNLKLTIEGYITQEIANASANKSSLSTLILAKLNHLRVNALLKQPKQCVEQLPYYVPAYCSPPEEYNVPEDLSMKRNKHDYPEVVVKIEDEDMDYEEPTLVIDESYVEMQSADETITESTEKEKIEKEKIEKLKTENQTNRNGLHQLVNRVSGIFTFLNRTQSRMEELMKQGINVVTMTPVKRPTKKTSISEKFKKALATSSSSLSLSSSTSKTHPSSTVKKVTFNKKSLKSSNLYNQIPKPTSIHKELPITSSGGRNIVYERKPWTNGLGDDLKYNTDYPIPSPHEKDRVIIGINGTTISTIQWQQVDWDQTPPAVTRKILVMLFDREFLATHSLTGRPSPAFLELNYPEKQPLNPFIVDDIVNLVTSRTIATAKEIRMAITTKCADEAKMLRLRLKKMETLRMEALRMKTY